MLARIYLRLKSLWTPRLPLLCLLFFLLVLGQYFRTQINSPGIDHGSPLVIRYHWSDGLQAAEARYDQKGHCCRRWHQHLATESVARRRLRRLLQRFSINAAQTLTLNGPSLLGRESLQRCLVRLEINRWPKLSIDKPAVDKVLEMLPPTKLEFWIFLSNWNANCTA